MKYIICAKNILSGDLSVTDPLLRTELCTELIGTRMQALKMLEEGVILRGDCIVTRSDRFCLYENIFDNLIDWVDFVKLTGGLCLEEDYCHPEIIDLVSQINNGDIDTEENYRKAFYPIPEYALDFSFSGVKEIVNYNRPFAIILKRNNPNGIDKNLPDSIYHKIIEDLSTKGHVLIFGESNNDFSEKVTYIKSLKDYCSLLANENCKTLVSSCSGGVYPAFFCGHKNLILTIIDPNRYCIKHEDSPSFYNQIINFTHIRINKYYQLGEI